MIMDEIKVMKGINHANILKCLESGVGKIVKAAGEKEIHYIVTELAERGELFDNIVAAGGLDEPTSRYFMKQFLAGLDEVHFKKIAHRDLKPENLLINKDGHLKIIDFGMCGQMDGKSGGNLLKTKVGTKGYQAPEMLLGEKYEGTKIDLFAAGVILFMMNRATPPFNEASPNDAFFMAIAQSRADKFWKAHGKMKPLTMSEEMKSLIISLF